MTAEQADQLQRWSRQVAGNKVTLLLDCDGPGEEGAKEALWLLAERRLEVRLGWSQHMHGGAFRGRQPETLAIDDLDPILNAGWSSQP